MPNARPLSPCNQPPPMPKKLTHADGVGHEVSETHDDDGFVAKVGADGRAHDGKGGDDAVNPAVNHLLEVTGKRRMSVFVL